ncbi:DNA (cytosine-5)-methyltransferase 1 [Novosphingobium sp. PhB57]|uniref:DNA cytosine methyltransferase n=1 Tax=Novosphingobium sp. PhB57 TaxID=2485107 RepID=UPI0010DF29FE|nr:DNA cytosine methyltransferase [Novosphingobium sp. PhB57]TCU52342.1 DNA (cytosine-5)-methyltransferase 1 [Novosphingobium sp. PhB57]
MKCISLFSGAGGLDVGAKAAGARIIRAVEFDKDAATTLRLNSDASTLIECADVATLDFHQHRNDTGDTIVIGGPPCQPFSKNGYWVRNENRLVEADPRNMLSQFLRVVSEANPKGFLLENVESLRHPTNKQALDAFVAAAEVLGYTCTVALANAADYGVPQKRKRVFIFGTRGSKTAIPNPERLRSSDPADGFPPHLGVKDFLKPFNSSRYFEPSEMVCGGTYEHELRNVPPGRNYMALDELTGYSGRTFRRGGRFWNFLYKLHPDEPSITIAAQPGPWVGPFHWNNRRLRAPEAAAIQTFPADYKFHGTRRSVQKQIGNAVPCLLGEAMVKHLMNHV